MSRIPIIIQGASSGNGGASGSGVEYDLRWNEPEMSLELRNSENSEVQKIELTGIGSGGGGGSVNLKEGYRIKIENLATGETQVSYVPGDNEFTEDDIKAIVADNVPTKLSDLTNDAGFVASDDLAPIALSGDYSDLSNAPAPYDDSAIQAAISNLDGKVSDLEIKDTLTVSEFFGQLEPGKEYPPGTPFIDILKDILDPPVPPKITEPKLTISGTDSGTDIPSGTTKTATITLTFNQGTISSGGNTVGAAIEYSLNGGAYQASNVFNVTVSETNKTFKGKVRYGEGDQPKDSKGENYGTPRSAGELESGTITYKFVTPAGAATLWSNAANILQVVQETSAKYENKQHVFHWCPQTEANPEIFDVPATWNITAIDTINDLNGQWESVSHNFDITDTTHNGVAFKRYTDAREFDDDGRDIRLTWT